MNKGLIVTLVFSFAVLILGVNSVYIVDERKQAIVFQLGELKDVEEKAGIHLKVPFAQQVVLLEKRIMSLDIPPREALTKDQKRLLIDSFTRYKIVDPLKRFQSARDDRGGSPRHHDCTGRQLQPRHQLWHPAIRRARAHCRLLYARREHP